MLYLPCEGMDGFPNYVTASLFHGLRTLLGDRVVDAPFYEYATEMDAGLSLEEQTAMRDIWGQVHRAPPRNRVCSLQHSSRN